MSSGFLERWSRRKAGEGQAEAAPDAVQPVAPAPQAELPPEPQAPPLITDEELAALPRIEDLTPDSNLAPFLRAGVPSGLKNAAMRKMWLLTPAIRDHNDCAVDYHWDWNTPGGVPGSGGRLEPDAVRKMLKGLTEPRPAQKPEAAEKPGADPDAPAETMTEATAQAPVDAQPGPDPAPDRAPQTASVPVEPPDTEPRRRHGGARPS